MDHNQDNTEEAREAKRRLEPIELLEQKNKEFNDFLLNLYK